MRFNTLDEWLGWQETLHPSEIELGLERITSVFSTLHPDPVFPTVITVAGTNGKGSSVAMLDAIYRAADYQVGSYTSPHLFQYNERICINGRPVDDQSLCDAFTRIDNARGETSLTYFEFGTLAALEIFLQHELDVVILEVGLGGRLDAVNIIDADVALITAIALDHQEWLGNNIKTIASEKAGIMRSGKPVVSSGKNAIDTLATCAADIGAQLYQTGKDFHFTDASKGRTWDWQSEKQFRTALPKPTLFGEHQIFNAAGVLMVIELLANNLPVSQSAIREGLMSVQLAGRFQILPGEPVCIFDVAHNADAMKQLAQQLQQYPCHGRTLAVLGMLSDKDIHNALLEVISGIDEWFLTPLATPRSESVDKLHRTLKSVSNTATVHNCSDVKQAFQAANKAAKKQDRIVVFGSFYTVAEAMPEPL